MFELVICKKGKYRNESLTYEYSSFQNMVDEINKWLRTGTIKENDIYNIRYMEVENYDI